MRGEADISVAQWRGRCQSTPNTFPERLVFGLPCVNLKNKKSRQAKQGHPGDKKLISDD